MCPRFDRAAASAPARSGVVEGAIEPPEGRQRPIDHRFDVALLRDVGSDEDRLAAGGLDPRDDFLALSLAASADDDLRALLGEFECGGTADPGVATRDEYDAACNMTREVLHTSTGSKADARAPQSESSAGMVAPTAMARERLPTSRRVPVCRHRPGDSSRRSRSPA